MGVIEIPGNQGMTPLFLKKFLLIPVPNRIYIKEE
jgi:hypothetical protein